MKEEKMSLEGREGMLGKRRDGVGRSVKEGRRC